jgi:hypothetical protein
MQTKAATQRKSTNAATKEEAAACSTSNKSPRLRVQRRRPTPLTGVQDWLNAVGNDVEMDEMD